MGTHGNISADPQFTDPTLGEYRLKAGSPCIDAGDDSSVQGGDTDANGMPRIFATHVDMGAYEFYSDVFITLEDAAIATESCQPANGVPDPGETIGVNVTLRNYGSAGTANFVATLEASDGVIPVTPSQNYGIIPSEGTVSKRFALMTTGVCGGTVLLRLHLRDGARDLGYVSRTFRLGVPLPRMAADYSSGGVTVAIKDGTAVEHMVTAPGASEIEKVVVRIRLDHADAGHRRFSLIGPDGTSVLLARLIGGDGDNFGSGAADCTGTFTVFDDDAPQDMSEGSGPFAGSFRPEQSLSTLNGKPVNGVWKLQFNDEFTQNIGTLFCWGLEVTYTPGFRCSACALPYTTDDVKMALAIWAGLRECSSDDSIRLDAVAGGGIDIFDAVSIARKVSGLEANP